MPAPCFTLPKFFLCPLATAEIVAPQERHPRNECQAVTPGECWKFPPCLDCRRRFFTNVPGLLVLTLPVAVFFAGFLVLFFLDGMGSERRDWT